MVGRIYRAKDCGYRGLAIIIHRLTLKISRVSVVYNIPAKGNGIYILFEGIWNILQEDHKFRLQNKSQHI